MGTYSPKQRGFTLIELLLYVSILGSLLISVSLYFATTADARVKNQSISEVNQQGVLAMELMAQTIRNSSSVTSPAAGGSAASLSLTGASSTVFDLSSGALRIQQGAGSPVPLTNSKVEVTGLTFRNLTRSGTPGVVQVEMAVARVNPNNKNEYSYSKTFISSAALRWP